MFGPRSHLLTAALLFGLLNTHVKTPNMICRGSKSKGYQCAALKGYRLIAPAWSEHAVIPNCQLFMVR